MKPVATPAASEDGQLPQDGGLEDNDATDAAEPCWSIGELAALLGVSTRTIRFYEARQLLTPERAKGARIYSRRDRARLQLILRGKNLGFSLEDIREYLSLYDADPDQVAQTQLLLIKVEASIGDLEQKRVDIERTLSELKELRVRARAFLRDKAVPERRGKDGG